MTIEVAALQQDVLVKSELEEVVQPAQSTEETSVVQWNSFKQLVPPETGERSVSVQRQLLLLITSMTKTNL